MHGYPPAHGASANPSRCHRKPGIFGSGHTSKLKIVTILGPTREPTQGTDPFPPPFPSLGHGLDNGLVRGCEQSGDGNRPAIIRTGRTVHFTKNWLEKLS